MVSFIAVKLLRCRTTAMGIVGAVLLTLGSVGCRTALTLSPEVLAEIRAETELEKRAAAHAHFAAGIVHELSGDAAAAYEEFFQAAKANPTDTDLLFDVSGRLIEGRQFPRALEVLNLAAALPEVDGMVFVRLGFVHAQLGNNRKAAEANEIAVRRLPRFMPARQNLYLSHLQARNGEAAWAVLLEAATLPDLDAEFQINLAELFADVGRQFPERRDAARAQALAALDKARDSVTGPMTLKLADGYYLLGEIDAAARAYLIFLERETVTPALREVLRTKLADIYLRQADRGRARAQLTVLVQENPANAGAHYFLGVLALQEKRWKEAVASLQRAVQIRPTFDAAQIDLATAQLAAGQVANGLAVLEKLRQTKPRDFAVEYLSGMAFHEQKNYQQALQHLTTAEAIAAERDTNRLTTGLYFQLGATAERAGERQLAVRYFEKSIALDPDHADALNFLGYMWAEQKENLKRARELIERALKLEPDNDAVLDSMGWVLFQQGDAAGALPYLLRAVAKLEAPDATVFDHLGDVYASLKEMDKAREAWAKSVAAEPSEKVQKKLEAIVPLPQ